MPVAPPLSIITITRDNRAGFDVTAASILAQRDQGFEWVVVDGASTDGTADHLRTLATPMPLRWVSEPDGGIYDAMNKGCALASGTFLLFLNAGDTLHDPDSVRRLREMPPDADLGFFAARYLYGSRLAYVRHPRRSRWAICHGVPACHQAILFRRALLQTHPYPVDYRICGDYHAVASIIANEHPRIHISDVVVSDYRMGGVSLKEPRRLMAESARVQRRVLGMSWPAILASQAVRVATITASELLYAVGRR